MFSRVDVGADAVLPSGSEVMRQGPERRLSPLSLIRGAARVGRVGALAVQLGALPAAGTVAVAGTPLDAHNVRRSFRRVVAAAGLAPTAWTPREMRHSFVSLLSDSGVPIEHISRLVGHSGTAVTETVYRQQLRPVLEEGATAMDGIFPTNEEAG